MALARSGFSYLADVGEFLVQIMQACHVLVEVGL